MKTPLRTFLDLVVVPQSGQTREPARPINIALQPVWPGGGGGGGGGGHLAVKEREVEELVSDNIKEPWLVHQSVHNGFTRLLLLECSEQSVPNTEPTAVVGVQTVPGGTVG